MKTEHSRYAVTYVAALQRALRRNQVTWSDMASAYDAGLNHGASLRGTERTHVERLLRALRIVNAVNKVTTP